VKALFNRVDVNKLGAIDFDEFSTFLKANPTYLSLFSVVRSSEPALQKKDV
jgi:hypothetical protein